MTIDVARLDQAWSNHESSHSGGCTGSGCLPDIVAEYGRLSYVPPCPECIEHGVSVDEAGMLYHHYKAHGVPLPVGLVTSGLIDAVRDEMEARLTDAAIRRSNIRWGIPADRHTRNRTGE